MGAKNWERFAFNQSAPLNKQERPELDLEDEEDKRDRQSRAAPPKTAAEHKHDDAIFGNAGVAIDRSAHEDGGEGEEADK